MGREDQPKTLKSFLLLVVVRVVVVPHVLKLNSPFKVSLIGLQGRAGPGL